MSTDQLFLTLSCCWVAASLVGGCSDNCLDDGLAQSSPADCGAVSATSDTASTGAEATDEGSSSEGAEGSDGPERCADGERNDDETDVDCGGPECPACDDDRACVESDDCASGVCDQDVCVPGTVYCEDADGDGFGNPEACAPGGDEPPKGSVPNADDCDDNDASTFPGAAELEDADACMRDADDDGWGDAAPGGAVIPGADCHDSLPALNPDTTELHIIGSTGTWRLGLDGAVAHLHEVELGDYVGVSGLAFDPMQERFAIVGFDDGVISNPADSHSLAFVDRDAACEDPSVTATLTRPPAGTLEIGGVGVSVCGLTYGPDGALFGLRSDDLIEPSAILRLDPETGETLETTALDFGEEPVADIGPGCGLAFDCHEQRLVWLAGRSGDVYSVEPATGAVVRVATSDEGWGITGMAYDPVGRTAVVTAARSGPLLPETAFPTELVSLALDGSGTMSSLPSQALTDLELDGGANLEFVPRCVSHCDDGVQNVGESDVDCGGFCAPCAVGRACAQPSDCSTATCTDNVCTR